MNSGNGMHHYRQQRILGDIVEALDKEKEMRVYFLHRGKKLEYSFKQERWDLPKEGDRVNLYKQLFVVISRTFDYDEGEIHIIIDRFVQTLEKGVSL